MAAVPSTSGGLKYVEADRWQAFVRANPESTPFHHVNWLALISRTYGMPVRIAALVDGDRVHAGVPFIETHKPWGNKRLVGLPFTDCIRPLARSDEALRRFTGLLPGFLAANYRAAVLKTDRPIAAPVDSGMVRHELALHETFDRLRCGFASTLRRNVRRAERLGLRFEVSTSAAALEQFYRLHVLTRRKLGVPVQPKVFFGNLHELIVSAGLGKTMLVSAADQVIAAAVFLEFNHTAVYKYGASDPARLAARPNDLLFYHALRLAVDAGMKRLDFGTSEVAQEGLRRFKRKWGAVECPVFIEYLTGQSRRPSSRASLAMNAAKAIIRRSPTIVCRLLGKTLYRYSA